MPLLNTANAVYKGAIGVDKVYAGNTQIWPSSSDAVYRDFEAYSDNQTATTSEWLRVEGDAPTYQNTYGYNGRTMSLFCSTASTRSTVAPAAYSNMDDFYVRLWLYTTTTMPGNARIIEPRTSANVITHQIRMTTGGKIDILDAASATAYTSSSSYNVNSWFSVGAHIVKGGSGTGQCIVRLYNTPGSNTPTEEFGGTANFNAGDGQPAWVNYGVRTTSAFTQSLYIGRIGYSATNWVPA